MPGPYPISFWPTFTNPLLTLDPLCLSPTLPNFDLPSSAYCLYWANLVLPILYHLNLPSLVHCLHWTTLVRVTYPSKLWPTLISQLFTLNLSCACYLPSLTLTYPHQPTVYIGPTLCLLLTLPQFDLPSPAHSLH